MKEAVYKPVQSPSDITCFFVEEKKLNLYNFFLTLPVSFVEKKKLFINMYNLLLRLPVVFVEEKNLFINLYNLLLRLPVVFG